MRCINVPGLARISTLLREKRDSSTAAFNRVVLKRAAVLLVIIGCLGLSGCTLRVSYTFLDWWIGWQIRDHVSLSRDQRKTMEQALDRFHLWHQSTQLPRYLAASERLQEQLQAPSLPPQSWQDIALEGQLLYEDSLKQLMPDLVTLFIELNDEQWLEFKQSIGKKHEKYAKRYIDVTPEERLKKRREHTLEVLKPWIGKPSEQQQQLIDDWNQALKPIAEMSLQQRQTMLARADSIYQQRTELARNDLIQQLWQLITNDRSLYSESHLELIRDNQQLTFELSSQLHASLSDKQRKRLLEELQSYQQDFAYLHERYLKNTQVHPAI